MDEKLAAKPYFTALNALRGVAALLVVLFHFDVLFAYLLLPTWSSLIAKSYSDGGFVFHLVRLYYLPYLQIDFHHAMG